MRKHVGGCHCKQIRFEVVAPAIIDVCECNCSICAMSGFLHLIVPADRFTLTRGRDALRGYRFNTGAALHLFCGNCGIKSFYVPRSHPDGYSVNARCLDDGTVERMIVSPIDGRNWEAAFPAGRGHF